MFSGSDKIPSIGFEKQIDIFFEEINFLKISTCGLHVTFPFSDAEKKLRIAIKYGGGFGVV